MAEQQTERQALKRRGLIAGAAALVAGIAAKQTAQPVRATTTDTNFVASAGSGAAFRNTAGYSAGVSVAGSTYGIAAVSSGGDGIVGSTNAGPSTSFSGVKGQGSGGSTYGVYGAGDGDGTGVFGTASTGGFSKAVWGKHRGNGYGVYGEAGAGGGYGVTGMAVDAFGVLGQSTSGIGVQGQILGAATNTIGVKGVNYSTGAGGNGVYGESALGYRVVGYSTGGSASLAGISTDANIPAFAGGNAVAAGLAASFGGTVYVNGMFVVADMTQKHGLLKHPDGSHRLMYTVEAPESWAEDFGTGTLAGGKAEIKLDPDFAALIHTEEYHVFLTEHAHHHLAVTQRGAAGFTVAADPDLAKVKGKLATDLSGTFSWRVVAKPKTDHKSERLGKFVVPNIPLPDVSKLKAPEISAVTKKP